MIRYIIALLFCMQTAQAATYEVSLVGYLDDYKKFEHIVDAARDAQKGDVIEMTVNSQGGDIYLSQWLKIELNRSKAKVIVIIDKNSRASSATAMLITGLKYSTEYRIHDRASIMFHCVVLNKRGEARKIDRNYTLSYFYRIAHGRYAKRSVLTSAEFETMLYSDIEIKLTGKEYMKRVLNATRRNRG